MSLYIMVFNRLPYTLQSKGMGDITKAIANFTLEFEDPDNLHGTIKEMPTDNKSCSSSINDSILGSHNSQKNAGLPKMRTISEGLKFFLMKMLEKDPQKRATIEQLMKDTWLNSEIE